MPPHVAAAAPLHLPAAVPLLRRSGLGRPSSGPALVPPPHRPAPDGAAVRRVLDLRLVTPALAAWAAAWLVVLLPPATARAAAVGGAAVALVLLVLDAREGGRVPAPSMRATAAFALLVAGAVLGAGAAQVERRADLAAPSTSTIERGPGSAARAGQGTASSPPSRVALTGTVQPGARRLPPAWPGAPTRTRVLVAVEAIESADGSTRASGTVVVLGPEAWSDAPAEARVRVAGRWTALPAGERAAALLVTDEPPMRVGDPPSWHRAAEAVRATVKRQAAVLPGDAGALLPGVTVGDTGAVPEDLREALRVAGLTHLTAVSGAHFALVGALAVACVAATGARHGVQAVAVVGVGTALVTLVGPSPSVLRAAAMAAVGCAGLLVGRRSASPAALSAAVVVLLVADPWLARELGFLLSVLATGGLVLLGTPLAARWRSVLPHPVAAGLAAPVAAQAACAPAILLVGPTVSVLAVPANLLAAPAVAPATVLGLAGALVGTWWPAAGGVLAALAGAACWWIGAVARAVAAAPGATLSWLPGAPGVLLLAVACACAVRVLWPVRAGP